MASSPLMLLPSPTPWLGPFVRNGLLLSQALMDGPQIMEHQLTMAAQIQVWLAHPLFYGYIKAQIAFTVQTLLLTYTCMQPSSEIQTGSDYGKYTSLSKHCLVTIWKHGMGISYEFWIPSIVMTAKDTWETDVALGKWRPWGFNDPPQLFLQPNALSQSALNISKK